MRNREAFEEWYSGTYRETIHILPNGQYASLRQQHSWDAWQARVPEGYVVVPKEPTYEMIDAAIGNNGHIESIYRDMIKTAENEK